VSAQTPDLNELLRRAQEVQQRLAEAQRELARRTVEASSGGGLVTAVATGEPRIVEVRIDPALLATGDREMLQDLVAAAVNAALAAAVRMVQEELQRLAAASGMALRPGPFGS
jgi:DNA-binding YbaB/EbfC family protein